MLPREQFPTQVYQLALNHVDAFKGMEPRSLWRCRKSRKLARNSISKNFVTWYTAKEALKPGKKGVLVVSISPAFNTPTGKIEGEQPASFALMAYWAVWVSRKRSQK